MFRQHMATWGVVPAAGAGTRIQPLAFSKELLPLSVRQGEAEARPRAVGEFIVERFVAAGADRLCFVIAPGKSDIVQYFGGTVGGAPICYVLQDRPSGLCDAVFRAAMLVHADDRVFIGLPDTVWFPVDALRALPESEVALLLFPVQRPALFDAVVTRSDGSVVLPRGGSSTLLDGMNESRSRMSARHSRSSAVAKCATPLVALCVIAPPSSSLLTSSCVTVLITSGPVTNM